MAGSHEFHTRMPPAERTPSAYVQEVRQKLDASEDPQLLRRVGSRLGWSSYRLDPKQQALAQRFLERALELDPKLRSARAEPFRIRLAERHRRIHEAWTAGRPVDEADRLAYEASRSAGAYMGGETLEYYKKDVAGARAKFEEASKQAQETLRLAEERPQDPSYSSSVATTRFVLAAVAMREGNRDRAVGHLMEATKIPPSEETSYMPLVFWLKPVNYLLKAGERERVIEFLEAFARVSEAERDRLLKDAEDIRSGRMPMSYQHMVAMEGSPEPK